MPDHRRCGRRGVYFEKPLPTSEKSKYTGWTVMLIDDRAISQAEHQRSR